MIRLWSGSRHHHRHFRYLVWGIGRDGMAVSRNVNARQTKQCMASTDDMEALFCMHTMLMFSFKLEAKLVLLLNMAVYLISL